MPTLTFLNGANGAHTPVNDDGLLEQFSSLGRALGDDFREITIMKNGGTLHVSVVNKAAEEGEISFVQSNRDCFTTGILGNMDAKATYKVEAPVRAIGKRLESNRGYQLENNT